MRKSVRKAEYDVASRLWTCPPLTIAAVSDLHVCDRWTPLGQIDALIDQIHAAGPDLILLPGDFLVRKLVASRPVSADRIATVLARLSAPLGVYASLGNHDWKDCPDAQANGYSQTSVAPALEAVGIPVLSNRAVLLANGAWLVGLDSQIGEGRTYTPRPHHDAKAGFADVPDGAPVLLMAHEPDIFLEEDRPVALQLSGHTHGGQIGRLGMWLMRPSRFGSKLGHGHIRRGDRNLIVGAGIGYSTLPLRLWAESEFVVVRLRSV